MDLQIKKLILWPRTLDRQPRVVPFRLGAVNVISGLSKTGKSAVIPIIDYCLGADKCAIPVATIRNACSWFGVVVNTEQGELLLARREPGNQKGTGDMYVIQAAEIDIPHRIEQPNTNVSNVKIMLDEMAGLTRLTFDTEGAGLAFRDRPSFRDMMAFVFQPQNIVANPNVLFYKADTTEHREKLKAIFPYVLGAVTPEALALMHERTRIRLDVRRKERELDAIRQVSARWIAEIRAKASRAYELGLLLARPADTATVPQMIQLLRGAIAANEATRAGGGEIRGAALGAVSEELVALEREEKEASEALSRLKQRFADMTRLRAATSDYRGSLSIRRNRLEVSDWLATLIDKDQSCPFCGTNESPVPARVAALQSSLRTIEGQTNAIDRTPAAFDREYERVRREMDPNAERVNAIRLRRRIMQTESDGARARQYELTETARFVGGLEEALSRLDELASDGDLAHEVEGLRLRLSEIDQRLRDLDPESAIQRTLQRFTLLIARILPNLDSERPNDAVQLVIEDLTLKVAGDDRDDYLWEIGSGANWLAYHVATSVALHQLFRGLRIDHVPTFVIYDQPSQVYFPRHVVPDMSETSGDAGSDEARTDSDSAGKAQFRDEDVIQVRKVFQVLSDAVRTAEGQWQAIILDHAGEDVWGGVPGVHSVEDWHSGETLVPREWLQ